MDIFVKGNRLSKLCKEMSNEHEVIGEKWKRKTNGLLQKQIEWHNWLSDYVDERQYSTHGMTVPTIKYQSNDPYQ